MTSIEPGTRFGDYVLHRPLGQGGMADVFLAQRIGASQLCVLKRVRAELSDAARARMLREANAGTYLDHPNVVQTLDAGSVDGAFFIAVELIVGVNLTTLVKRRLSTGQPVPLGITLAVALGVLDGLTHAHDAVGPDGNPLGIVHRDLSPNNVMVGRDGVVKVIDFGLVRADVGDFETRAGMLMGTLQYVSPEQAAGERVDRRADLYSLAIVLHEIIARRTAIPQRDNLMAMVREVLTARLDPVAVFDPSIPPGVAQAIDRCLEKSPEARFATAEDFASQIRASAGTRTASQDEVGSFVRSMCPEVDDLFIETQQFAASIGPVDAHVNTPTMAETAPPTVAAVLAPEPLPVARSSRPLLLAGAGVLLSVLAVGGVLLTRPSRTTEIDAVLPAKPPPATVAPGVVPLVAPTPPREEEPAEAPAPRKRARPRRATRPRTKSAPKVSIETPAPVDEPKRPADLDIKLQKLQSRGARLDRWAHSDELKALLSDMTMEATRDENVPLKPAKVAEFERRLKALEAAAKEKD